MRPLSSPASWGRRCPTPGTVAGRAVCLQAAWLRPCLRHSLATLLSCLSFPDCQMGAIRVFLSPGWRTEDEWCVSAQNGGRASLSGRQLSLARLRWGQRTRSGEGTELPSGGIPLSAPPPSRSRSRRWLQPPSLRSGPICHLVTAMPATLAQCPAVMPASRNAWSRSLQPLLRELMHHGLKVNTCHTPGSGAHPAGARRRHTMDLTAPC